MDTVWLKLTAMPGHPNDSATAKDQYTMFGPSGVVQFEPYKGGTLLSNTIAVVETPEYILNAIATVRGTVGRFNVEGEDEENNSESEASSTKESIKD